MCTQHCSRSHSTQTVNHYIYSNRKPRIWTQILLLFLKHFNIPAYKWLFHIHHAAFLFLLLPPGAINNLIMFWNSQFVYRGRAVWYLAPAKLLKMVSEREALEREPLCCLSAAGLILLALLGTRSPVNLRLQSSRFLRVGSLCARSGGPAAETAKGLCSLVPALQPCLRSV